MSTAPSVCALGWVKCREHISLLVILCIIVYVIGLCDMDQKKLSRFFEKKFDFDFNHDFDTNRHALQL